MIAAPAMKKNPNKSWQRRWALKTGTIPAPDAFNARAVSGHMPPDRLEAVARYSGARLKSNENLTNSKKNREKKK